MTAAVAVYAGEALARYAFGHAHPFGPYRLGAFLVEFERRGYNHSVDLCAPVATDQASIELFHTHEYVDRVRRQSESGRGYLDWGDTPAFPGVYEAAATVVGTTLAAVEHILSRHCRRAFVPIAGLHHARRDEAAGFCVFNDCGVAIEARGQSFTGSVSIHDWLGVPRDSPGVGERGVEVVVGLVEQGPGSVQLVGTDGDAVTGTVRGRGGLRRPTHRETVEGDTLVLHSACPSLLTVTCDVTYHLDIPHGLAVDVDASGGGFRVRAGPDVTDGRQRSPYQSDRQGGPGNPPLLEPRCRWSAVISVSLTRLLEAELKRPFGQADAEGRVRGFRLGVGLQFLAKPAHLEPNDGIVAGIVGVRFAERLDAYRVLLEAVGLAGKRFCGEIFEEPAMGFGGFKGPAAEDAVELRPYIFDFKAHGINRLSRTLTRLLTEFCPQVIPLVGSPSGSLALSLSRLGYQGSPEGRLVPAGWP